MIEGGTRAWRAIIVVAALIALASCASTASAGTRSVRSMLSSAESRSYVVYRPSTAPASGAPLIIVLHGSGSSGGGMESLTRFDTLADQKGFVMAYPDAVKDPSSNTNLWRIGCCTAWQQAGTDVTFISNLIDAMASSDKIDTSRVFIVGFSVGAAMAYRLGCELASRVAGIGSVGGFEYLSKQCSPDRSVTVYEIHGTKDYYGGSCGGTSQTNAGCSFGQPGYEPSVQQTNAQWRGFDRCGAMTSSTTTGNLTAQVWDGCSGNQGVRLDTIQNGTHCYPTPGSTACASFDATASFWSFFANRKLTSPGAPSPTPGAVPIPPATPTPPTPPPTPTPATPSTPSLSAPVCVVPSLRTMTLTQARRRLKKTSCLLGTVTRPRRHHRGRRLVIASQSLRAGRPHKRGTKVDVVLRDARAMHVAAKRR